MAESNWTNAVGPSTSNGAVSELKCHSCMKNAVGIDKPVYYLPCLHILCHHCRDIQKTATESVKCHSCNRIYPGESVYDDFNSDPRRTKCMSSNCTDSNEERITTYCVDCKMYLCSWCGKDHDSSHFMRESKTYVPIISRCINPEHQDRVASFVCACNGRICNECLSPHRQICPRSNVITSFGDVSAQALNCMKSVIENDKRVLHCYQNLLRNVHNKRRLGMAEYHNARMELAHNCRRMVSLLIRRFQDLADVLETSQTTFLAQCKKAERLVGAELNQFAKINNLESKIFTLKPSRIIPFASFIKAASSHLNDTAKFNKIALDQVLPPITVRFDFSHNSQTNNFAQFLCGYGILVVNSARTQVKSTFDKPMLFEQCPKVNVADVAKTEPFGLRRHNGHAYEEVNVNDLKKRVKPMAEDELRQRVVQLESQLTLYKKLLHDAESRLETTPETARFSEPRESVGRSPAHEPSGFGTNGFFYPQNGLVNSKQHRQLPYSPVSTMHSLRAAMNPHLSVPPVAAPPMQMRAPPPPNMDAFHQRQLHLFNQALAQNGPPLAAMQRPHIPEKELTPAPPSIVPPSNPSSSSSSIQAPKNVVMITLEDDETAHANPGNEKPHGSLRKISAESAPCQPTLHPAPMGNSLTNQTNNERRAKSSERLDNIITALGRRKHLPAQDEPCPPVLTQGPTSNSTAPTTSCTPNAVREKSLESRGSEESERALSTTSSGRFRAVAEATGGLKIRIRREPVDEEREKVHTADVGQNGDDVDEWDDYCFACNEGCDDISGELGCCSQCPHVFHQLCHVPQCTVPMKELPDDWRCTCCAPFLPLTEKTDSFGENVKLVCSKVLLECLSDSQQSEPFRKPVEKQFVQYYKVITCPMDFGTINQKISRDVYKKPDEFIWDMNQVFINCSTYNRPESEVALSGIKIYQKYVMATKKLMPAYSSSLWMYITIHKDEDPPTKKKRRVV